MPNLRDTLEQAFDQVTDQEPAVTTDDPQPERVRDEHGRFAGKQEKQEVKEQEQTTQKVELPQQEAAAKRPQRPSSWKKEYWDHWEKLDPPLAEYILSRESDYARGVSTYKAEADKAKELWDAITPYQQSLQTLNLTPAQQIQRLMQSHQELSASDPSRKLRAFMELVRSYEVPLQALTGQQTNPMLDALTQQVYGLQSKLTSFEQLQQREKEEAQKRIEAEAEAEIVTFSADKPNFEQVRASMAGLLQSGLANDLADAYEKAIRLDPELFNSVQQQKKEAEEKQRREEQVKLASSARAKVVSPKTSTPAGGMTSTNSKGRRAAIEEAFDQHTG